MRQCIQFLIFSVFLPTITIAQDFSVFKYRNVGPLRGGRVTAVTGTVMEPGTFYLGGTGAGVWKTTDYGTSWENVSDGFFKTPSIGAISVSKQDPNIVYVGTGTDGLRSNVITGKGVYKSMDAGSTWEHVGLENVGQIGAVEVHPYNHNIVYVAAIGQPFGANPERGIFKTTNGGKSWEKILFVSEKVGFRDVVMLPGNPEILYASAWKAERKPWTIISGGDASEGGIWKSVDGGKNWRKLTDGLPSGLIGKIDLGVTPADSKIIYALIEAPGEEGGVYKSVDQGKSFKLMSNKKGLRTRPFYYTNIEVDPTNPDVVYVLATGYYKSEDGGKRWRRMSSPHGDNHDMWINPENPDLFIQSNDGGANVTHNGGKTWSTQFNQPTSEIYQVEVDHQFPYWLYGGMQDNYSTISVPSNPPAGIQATDVGWIINSGGCETGPAVPKPGNPDIVYANCKGRFGVYNKITGTEKAYYVGASNMYGHNPKDLEFRFQRVSPIHVSPHDPSIIYHASQYLHKTTDEGVTWETISPDLTAFEEGKQVISGSPITRDITGEEFYSTIYSVRESPVKEGVIWTGANDGPVYVTTDGGKNWNNVTPAKLPAGGRVDAVEPSPHDPAKAYVAVLRYQLNDWKPYIYKTENYGKKWELLTDGQNGIPADYPTRVVREHPDNEGLLFAGTEFGIYVSFDDGKSWKSFQQNLPVVPITDIKLHNGDLIMSTMGRGFWIADDIYPLLQYDGASEENLLMTASETIRYRSPRIRIDRSEVPQYTKPSVVFDYFLTQSDREVKLEIYNIEGEKLVTYLSDTVAIDQTEVLEDMANNSQQFLIDRSLSNNEGMNRFYWNMRLPGPWDQDIRQRYQFGPVVAPGQYKAKLFVEDEVLETSFELLPDPRWKKIGTSLKDVKEQLAFNKRLVDLLSEAKKLEHKIKKEIHELEQDELSSDESQRQQVLKETLGKLREKDITYPQPKLIDQMEYLYYMTSSADQQLGKDAFDQFEELKKEFEKIKVDID
ncbi:MAG: hypothetical protein R3345_01090 [Fulvivirga sp.]|nr:hypothetical protein [Fulvivirga sp.]